MSNREPAARDHRMPEKALKELFAQSHDRGRAGLPVMSLSMGRGLVPRNQDERRVETNLGDEEHRLVRAGELRGYPGSYAAFSCGYLNWSDFRFLSGAS